MKRGMGRFMSPSAGALSLAVALLAATIGCTASLPPVPVQEAIRTIDRHLPAYVEEANRALAASDHPEKERLIGIGERLARAVAALKRWATNGEAKAPALEPADPPSEGKR